MEIILLIDIENQNTINSEDMVSNFKEELNLKNIKINKIGFASKDANLLSRWIHICLNILELNKDDVISIKSKPGANSGDMALCFLAGYLINLNNNSSNFLIISEDRILSSTMNLIKRFGGKYSITTFNKQNFTKKNKVKEIVFEIEKYPFLKQSDQNIFPRILCRKSPREGDPVLDKIIIHDYGHEITLGRDGSDINLDYWDWNGARSKTIY